MNDLKKLQPRFLQPNSNGTLTATITVGTYDHLGHIMCNLINSIDLLADFMITGAEHRKHDEIGLAISGITEVLNELSGVAVEDMHLLDKLREAQNK